MRWGRMGTDATDPLARLKIPVSGVQLFSGPLFYGLVAWPGAGRTVPPVGTHRNGPAEVWAGQRSTTVPRLRCRQPGQSISARWIKTFSARAAQKAADSMDHAQCREAGHKEMILVQTSLLPGLPTLSISLGGPYKK